MGDAMDPVEGGRGAMRVLILLAMIQLLPAACAGREEAKADLTLACQLAKCVCTGADRLFFKRDVPQPVLWTDDGDAFCPEGFELNLAKD
jgi:hypothetical protein